MAKSIQADEGFLDLPWPEKGIDVSCSYGKQPPLTTPSGINVRTYEPSTDRPRGGCRPGTLAYTGQMLDQNGSPSVVRCLQTVVGVGYTDPAGGSSSPQSGRIVNLVGVCGSVVYVTNSGGVWVASNGSNLQSSSGQCRSSVNNQKVWFADGVGYFYYDPSINSVSPWAATDGSLPQNGSNTPRLICTWRGRTVLSGIATDGQNWFMSKVNDPTNWQYFPVAISPDQAVAGNASSLGLVGDVVTALIPYTDDILILGCDHTIWQFSGDPMAGGQIDLVTDVVGIAWGDAWCKSSDGTLYFMSNRGSIYSMRPGEPPVKISQQIDSLLSGVNTGTQTVRLMWDDRSMELYVFVTTTASSIAATHYTFEARCGAWWQDRFAVNNYNPVCCCVFDGSSASDRVCLIGSWIGTAYAINQVSTGFDAISTAIASSVVLGPILATTLDEFLLKDLQVVLGSGSGTVTYQVNASATAEVAATFSSPQVQATWQSSGSVDPGGRNYTSLIRRAGHAIYVKMLASGVFWSLDTLRARIAGKGKVRRRGI